MDDKTLLRNVINIESAQLLAERIKNYYTKFEDVSFMHEIKLNLYMLNFKDRINFISSLLFEYLPANLTKSIDILLNAQLPKTPYDEIEKKTSFITLPQLQFVRNYGHIDYDLAMNALYEMTQRCSAEFAIRKFITFFPSQILDTFQEWSQDPNPHVRRLVSEGSRPRLPLAEALPIFKKDPQTMIPFLSNLKFDDSLYVRRSIANHVNDISKDNPQIACDLLAKWKKEAHTTDHKVKVEWITKYALRYQVKHCNQQAMLVLGYKTPQIMVKNLQLKKDIVKAGEYFEFSFSIQSQLNIDQKLIIDYSIYFLKSNGKLSPTPFKIKNTVLKANQSIVISKKQKIDVLSTRKIYTGEHKVEIQINGHKFDSAMFHIEM